jgi:hypothetical protein
VAGPEGRVADEYRCCGEKNPAVDSTDSVLTAKKIIEKFDY